MPGNLLESYLFLSDLLPSFSPFVLALSDSFCLFYIFLQSGRFCVAGGISGDCLAGYWCSKGSPVPDPPGPCPTFSPNATCNGPCPIGEFPCRRPTFRASQGGGAVPHHQLRCLILLQAITARTAPSCPHPALAAPSETSLVAPTSVCHQFLHLQIFSLAFVSSAMRRLPSRSQVQRWLCRALSRCLCSPCAEHTIRTVSRPSSRITVV